MWANSKAYMRSYMRNYFKNKPGKYEENKSRKRAAYSYRGQKKPKKKGVEIDHKNSNPKDNRKSNLKAISRTANRRKWAMEAVAVRKRRARNWGKY